MSDEINNSAADQIQDDFQIDFSCCCPTENTPAEPYHAIMTVNDNGETDGTLWGQGTKLMLFDDIVAAQKIIEALGSPAYKLRGVSKAHLNELKKLEESGRAELFVIIGFTPRGAVEAMPLAEHQARVSKAGNPPPIRKH